MLFQSDYNINRPKVQGIYCYKSCLQLFMLISPFLRILFYTFTGSVDTILPIPFIILLIITHILYKEKHQLCGCRQRAFNAVLCGFLGTTRRSFPTSAINCIVTGYHYSDSSITVLFNFSAFSLNLNAPPELWRTYVTTISDLFNIHSFRLHIANL